MANKTFLVTGGTGFIGAALVTRLLENGHSVRVLDNNSRGEHRRLQKIKNDFELINADIRDADVVASAIKGTDSVIHLAYINGTEFFYSRPHEVLEIAVKGMMNVLDACIAGDVADLVVASSSEVYQTPPSIPVNETVPLIVPDPLNPRYSYGGGKIISELLAINYGRKYFERVSIFRPHNVYGPDMGWEHVLPQFVLRMKRQIAEGCSDPIPFSIQGTGNETRAFIYIDDFIDGLSLIIEQGKHQEIYHIGLQKETKIASLADYVGDYFGRDVKIIPSAAQKGGTHRRCPDISKIKELGFQPTIPIEKGIPILAKWYDENADLAP